MMSRRRSVLLLPCAIAGFASTALAEQRAPRSQSRGPDPQASATQQLNQQALARAQQGQNALTPGADTTQNLNAMSERAAQQGRNMNRAPMPLR